MLYKVDPSKMTKNWLIEKQVSAIKLPLNFSVFHRILEVEIHKSTFFSYCRQEKISMLY